MELSITLLEIEEVLYEQNDALISNPEVSFNSQIGFELYFNSQEELLMVVGKIIYVTTQEETVAQLHLHYKVKVEGLAALQPNKDAVGVEGYNLPRELVDTAIGDTYASARLMLARHFKGTRMDGVYLPFGGAARFLTQMKVN